ncbi:ribosome maturation factor RimP [Marchantia polymorpha subsp. ruderalis]|nr:hypothetical protein MARPO_0025s0053 [Marchantia polymorpha]BBN03776.1 hypothetical protein Mp_2g26310 [Marchantia polymorpha subsp. ruderalis]|eukprot:PTQ43359.1 hypothetical protein MARPO_0025s0053 [Marchantia polymorpha]
MQGSFALPQRLSQQSLTVVHSSRSFAPELGGAFRICQLQPFLDCNAVGDHDRRYFPSGRIASSKVTDIVNEFYPGSRVRGRGLSLADYAGFRRMRGKLFASLASCSYPTSMSPSVSHRVISINGQTLDHSSWKSLVSGIPGPFRHNPALPWYSVPSGALRGLKTKQFGSISSKKTGQDVLARDSDKGSEKKWYPKNATLEKDSIAALYSSDSDSGDEMEKNEKLYGKADTGFDYDSGSESDDDEEDTKKQKNQKKMRDMEEEDSESDSDDDERELKMSKKNKMKEKVEVIGMCEEHSESDSDDEEELKKKKSMSKGTVEVVGMCEEDSDSDSEDDEEKEMRKKMKADEKELKKQAKKEKKELKAMKKLEEDTDVEDRDKKKKRAGKSHEDSRIFESNHEHDSSFSKGKVQVAEMEERDSSSDSEHDGDVDDIVEVVSDTLNVDELEEEEFELVGDDDLVEEAENEIEDYFEEFEDEDLDDDFWEEEEGEAKVGDGGDGGGVVLGETQWGSKALELAEEVVREMGTDFSIFAFKASTDGLVRVRLDKLSDQYGSPTMTDIEKFSRKYSEVLDNSGLIPQSVAVEVSSPGAERMVKVPDDLERFKQLPMYVQYLEGESVSEEKDGVLELESLDPESGMTVWKLANVKFNREQSGKGRPFNSKQRKWRAHVPVNALKLVRLHLDV